MIYAFKHVSRSYQIFKTSDSALKSNLMTGCSPGSCVEKFDKSDLDLEKSSST